ncbi:Sensor histidine kinase YycG [Sulfitobacter sp. THAF37]|uniref:PAS domain-containing sensor histidine kinase n=1 Tax=Sulfitobacter sp. THAF37 TaxID=2587855 RepID=UPI0012694CDC|nr:PAS domain-containing sensor histidine kinase [Sulfitobacter sp. THAF37]QFT59062.1 Sensor histidine kinase YycG [Sulfitobacter sp. THAF37]
MRSSETKFNLLKNVALGGGGALGWYAASRALIPGPLGEVIPAASAIAIAALLPTYLGMRRATLVNDKQSLMLGQRIDVLNDHAIVNVVDAETRLVEVNDHFVKATGYSRDELIGVSMHDFYQDEDGELAPSIHRCLSAGKIWIGETPIRCKDGSTLYTHTTVRPIYDLDGNWIGSISARTDVTETHELLAARDTAQVMDEMKDDIWIVDCDTMAASYMNRVALGRLGLLGKAGEVIPLADLQNLGGVSSIIATCRDMRSTGADNAQFETEFCGKPFHISVNRLKVGTLKGRFMILMADMSKRVLEEQRKSDFISTVSHELRSPLTSIKGAMGLLLSRAAGELPDKAVSMLEIAHRNSDRLVLIINDILDLEKIAAGRMEYDRQNVDLTEMIEETERANATMQQRFSVQVEITGGNGPIWINTDPNRIIQVLNNFLSNACKFSRPGSTVRILVEDQGDSVRVAVKDQGEGIPIKDQHKIFERFADMENSNRSSKGGTGLGLSICKAIVEGLGGTIGFETTEGVGTTFYFVLPKQVAKTEHIAPDNIVKMRSVS